MICLTSYSQKRDLVQAYRKICDWYFNFCDCKGPIPTMESNKADEHKTDCPYRIRIEREQ